MKDTPVITDKKMEINNEAGESSAANKEITHEKSAPKPEKKRKAREPLPPQVLLRQHLWFGIAVCSLLCSLRIMYSQRSCC